MNNIEKVFTNIYEKDLWTNGSGPGSTPEATKEYRDVLIKIIKEKNIKTVLDYGCGDWQFSRFIDWENLVDSYLGVDIVKHVIENNINAHQSDKIKFQHITDEWEFKKVDLIICKDVLEHLPNALVKDLLGKMSKHSKYLLLTDDYLWGDHIPNIDIDSGEWRLLDLTLPPWNIPCEVALIRHRENRPSVHTLLITSEFKQII